MDWEQIILWSKVVVAFFIIVVASNQLAQVFKKIKLPLITGFIVIGVIAGPYILKMLPKDLGHLSFINDIALGFIAFAAGTEMYLKEIRARSKPIVIMTASQVIITFLITFVILFLFIDKISFATNFSDKVAVSFILLTATLFIAPSIATTISMTSELRANGAFTKTTIGVTVFKDILLIIIFSIVFSLSEMFISGEKMHWYEILIVFLELALSIGIGLIYGKIYKVVFKIKKVFPIEVLLFLIAGWSTFILADLVKYFSESYLHFPIHLEAILIGITASFYLVNYTNFRLNVERLVEKVETYVYVTFFTLVGVSLSLSALAKYWLIALLFFALRLVLTFISSAVGSLISKERPKEALFSWMPHVAQAGISLGLITIVADSFDVFGQEFAAILIAVIVLNQFIGPPLMKFAITKLGEAHTKANNQVDSQKNIFIVGLEGKSIFLARKLKKQNYNVKILTDRVGIPKNKYENIELLYYKKFDLESFKDAGFKNADAIIIFKEEKDAYPLCEIIYENFGTSNVIVKLNRISNINDFEKLGVIVVEPASAMVNLLEHFVKSPKATSILLGMQNTQETVDIEVLSKDVHGRTLRDIKLPLEVLIISITRNGEVMLPHGYSRLRLNDIVTIVGSEDKIEKVITKLQY